jgi:uncharacterized protein (TIGR03000 family)
MFSQPIIRFVFVSTLAIFALTPDTSQAQLIRYRPSPWSYGYYYPYYYPTPGYGYYPGYTYSTYYWPGYIGERYGPAPAPNSSYFTAEQTPAPATINVNVPADAELWLQGVNMNLTGTQRQFVTPALGRDRDYMYDIRARWQQNGQDMDWTRHVRVRGGEEVTVDFLSMPAGPKTFDTSNQLTPEVPAK